MITNSRTYPDGIDCVWLAADDEGRVAAFVTAGIGPIPLTAMALGEEAVEDLEGSIVEMPRFSEARLLAKLPRPDDFIAIAERGIFAFDWRDIHRSTVEDTQCYELIAAPITPINVEQLPNNIRSIALTTRISRVRFLTARMIDARYKITCIERNRS